MTLVAPDCSIPLVPPRRVGADAWSLIYPSILEKLQCLYEEGYKLLSDVAKVVDASVPDKFADVDVENKT
ncbi:hypothetical protein REPUB_Repub17cG0106300 [Reevesia pubescens]